MPILLPRSYAIPEAQVTPESAWKNRRQFLKDLGFSAGLLAAGCRSAPAADVPAPSGPLQNHYAYTLPAYQKNSAYTVTPVTEEIAAASHNNFYEFTITKRMVWTRVGAMKTRPWTVEVTGLCHRPTVFDIDTLLQTLPLEERIYRFRCVEAWAMVVPWIGFPLSKLLDRVEPLGSARYVRMVSLADEETMPNIRVLDHYPWPYFEALTMEEARNELTMLAVGIYGHALPNQHGAPLRLVVPWKYGFKNIKSIVRIELTEEKPPTFWNTLYPDEYGFHANVDPDVPHPRWSQATERMIPTKEPRKTERYNGYGAQVAHLYSGVAL